MKHTPKEDPQHHTYSGSRKEAATIIEWLMGKGYWLEASQVDGTWTVACGVEPDKIPAQMMKSDADVQS